jgi:tetratricopeptide (TPR) repeat protein
LKRTFNYELRLDVINNKRNERRDTVINFNDPTEILGDKLKAVLNFINPFFSNSDKLNFNYYTNQWDAFSAYFQGEKYWNKLDVTHSIIKYNEAKTIDTSYLLPYLKLAKVQRFNGKIIEAKKNIDKVIDNINVLYTVDSLKALAIYNLLEGRIREGIRYQREVKKYEPLNIETYYDIAEAYFEIRDISKAKEHYEKCLEIDNSFTPALNHYAYCLSHEGNHQNALEFFNKYVYFDSSANSFDSQGDGYFASGLLDSAIMAKKKGLEKNPELDYIYNNLGFIYLRKGMVNTALDHFKINIDLNSKSPENINEGLSNIAFGLYQIGKFNASIDTLLKAKSIYEKNDLMTRNHKLDWVLAMNYLAIEEYNKAEKIISEMKDMIEKYQLSPSNYHELLKYYYHLRFFFNVREGDEEKIKEVLNLFEYQIKNKVKDWSSPFDLAFFQTELGRILFEYDYYGLAEQQFKRALEYNQKYPFAHYYLSKILADDEEKTNENHELFMNVWANADESFLKYYNIIE